jgi:hypothetical protein
VAPFISGWESQEEGKNMGPITPGLTFVTGQLATPAAVRRQGQSTAIGERGPRRGGETRTAVRRGDAHLELVAIAARIPLDEAAREIVDYLRSEITAYERLPATSRHDLVNGIERIFVRCHGWLSSGVVLPHRRNCTAFWSFGQARRLACTNACC